MFLLYIDICPNHHVGVICSFVATYNQTKEYGTVAVVIETVAAGLNAKTAFAENVDECMDFFTSDKELPTEQIPVSSGPGKKHKAKTYVPPPPDEDGDEDPFYKPGYICVVTCKLYV
jgi:hypothetical protein